MKPILFSTPMVQAILAGQKTATRRVIKPQPASTADRCLGICTDSTDKSRIGMAGFGREYLIDSYARIPYLRNDILWVRETFTVMMPWLPNGNPDFDNEDVFYAATKLDADTVNSTYLYDDDGFDTGRRFPWKPSIHMPRKYARIFLRVTDVRAERLQDITETDALKEGIKYWDDVGCCCSNRKFIDYRTGEFSIKNDHAESFKTLWDGINASRGYGWDKNPWVWVYEFERITREEAMDHE